MFGKRIRNKKLETTPNYPIYTLESLAEYDLIDYQTTNLKTGIEQDEEKETDLKQVLQGGKQKIFIPEIVELEDDPYIEMIKENALEQPDEYFDSTSDAENRFIMTDSDTNFVESRNIDTNIFDFFFDTKDNLGTEQFENKTIYDLQGHLKKKETHNKRNICSSSEESDSSKGKKLSQTKKKSSLSENITDTSSEKYLNEKYLIDQLKKCKALISHFQPKFINSSLCFRKLTSHLRKHRRSEPLILDKFKRMYKEIGMLKEMAKMKEQMAAINREVTDLNEQIINITDEFVKTGQYNGTKSLEDDYIHEQKEPENISRVLPSFDVNLQLPLLYKQIYSRSRPKQPAFYRRFSFKDLISSKEKQKELARCLTFKNTRQLAAEWIIDRLKDQNV
ncbi:Polycomb enhancer protein, EPC [Pseudoloma neurophilia]|uniref:Polycomb enhancer protein, EPC n=1 Tax=Pseudoloma neurophilia TaxID=146866 RepID=A0A0R0M3M2_9MICR|nr:Polycomb enhancer protein, EPC [Pseudoloma neurophilia]